MSLTTFNISKDVYFKSIKNGFKTNIDLLNAVRQDFNRIDIIINNKKYDEYHTFLEYVKNNYPNFLEKILLISNQNAHFYYYNKIFNILSKKDFHLVSTDTTSIKYLKTEFTLNNLIKQATLINKYNVITIDSSVDKNIHRTMLVTTVIDLVILDPILIKIEYCDE
jgi:hypothetical protein|tara:strand:+ start:1191 stop:1688 length:498 start_codon:yes stop_codon:yes gene_type:complete